MKHLTKNKIELLLNDIYLKSKKNETFKPNHICAYYHLGNQLSVILHKFGYAKVIERGKYFYIGNPVTDKLVEEVYKHYFEYRKNQRNKKNNKEKLLFGETIKEYPKKEKHIEINKIGKLSEIRSRVAEDKRIINLIQDNIHLILKGELSKINEQIIEIKKEFKQLKDAIYNIDNYNEQIEKRLNGQIDYLSQELKNQNTAMYTIKDSQDRAINKLHLLSETPKKSFITKLFS